MREDAVGERLEPIGSLSWPSPASGADDTTVVDRPSAPPVVADEVADPSSGSANGRGDLQQILDMLSGVSSRLGDIERRQDRSEDDLLASMDAKLASAFPTSVPSVSAGGAGMEESKAVSSSERELDAEAARRSELFLAP